MWLVLEYISLGLVNGSVTLASSGLGSGSMLVRIASHFSTVITDQEMSSWLNKISISKMIISMSILYPYIPEPSG